MQVEACRTEVRVAAACRAELRVSAACRAELRTTRVDQLRLLLQGFFSECIAQ